MASQAQYVPVMDTEILTLDEVAAYLRLSKKTIYRMVRSTDLPAFKAATSWRVRRTDLEGWIVRQTRGEQRPL